MSQKVKVLRSNRIEINSDTRGSATLAGSGKLFRVIAFLLVARLDVTSTRTSMNSLLLKARVSRQEEGAFMHPTQKSLPEWMAKQNN